MKGSTVKGSGDSVVLFNAEKGNATTAKIQGNSEKGYFGVYGYDKDGKMVDVFVNTTDKYNGKVLLKGEPAFYQIISEGEWEIKFE